METDYDVLSTRTMVGLFVAGLSLGAVYALGGHTPLGQLLAGAGGGGVSSAAHEHGHGHEHVRARKKTRRDVDAEGEEESAVGADADVGVDVDASAGVGAGAKGVRKGKRKKKSQDKRVGEHKAGGEGEGVGGCGAGVKATRGGAGAGTVVVPSLRVVPGDFEGAGADVGDQEVSQQDAPSVQTPKKRKKKTKKQKQGKDGEEEEAEAGSEMDRDVRVAHLAVRGPRSGNSTDDSMPLSPSVSGGALPDSARVLVPLSQSPAQRRESRPEDTDSSWTHVDRRYRESSKSITGQAGGTADPVDATSSDMASTAGELTASERELDRLLARLRTSPARVGSESRKPAKRHAPIRAEAMVRALNSAWVGEVPIPGFSWEDYGEVEDSVLAHDADEEDEGEWGVVKSRHRTRPQLTPKTSESTAIPPVPAAPENMTKKQRQNARKREITKAAKAEAEAARQQGLAKHKRELERLRIIEQSRHGGGKQPSGGMQATVDEQGMLVWE